MAERPEINAGTLDRRVKLLRPVYNADGDEISAWEEAATVWASVAPDSAKESDDAARVVEMVTVKICIRYRRDIDARWRIRDRERLYEIKGLADVARRRVQLELNCLEIL